MSPFRQALWIKWGLDFETVVVRKWGPAWFDVEVRVVPV